VGTLPEEHTSATAAAIGLNTFENARFALLRVVLCREVARLRALIGVMAAVFVQ
jgi:hypothetical protein